MPGPRSRGSVRLSLPSVYAAGTVKHATLNQPFKRDSAEPLTTGLQPGTTLGRRPRLKPVTLGGAVRASGKPSWNVLPPLTVQPDVNFFATPLPPFRNLWPCPNGRSTAYAMVNRWRESNPASDFSARKLFGSCGVLLARPTPLSSHVVRLPTSAMSLENV